jgi:hypothetical protein
MLPGLSMACRGTGTQPVASVDWSAHMAFRPLGSRMATRAAVGSCVAPWLAPLRHPLSGLRPAQVHPVMRGGIKSTVGLCVGGVGNTVGEELGQRFDAGEVGGKRGHREVC